jgi:hypothetical protein
MSEIKTFVQCCSEIAKKYKLGNNLVMGHKFSYFEEAAELFANQFKHSVGDVSREELEFIFRRNCFEQMNVFVHDMFKKDYPKLHEAIMLSMQEAIIKLSTPKESDAVEFAEWLINQGYWLYENMTWKCVVDQQIVEYNSKQVYELFLKTKDK